MSEYKKITKKDIDFPRYCLYFIKKIQDKINSEELNDNNFLEVHVETNFPYCSEAFDLITKTFERKGIDVMTPTFKIEYKFNSKYYNYRWRVRRCKDFDDLPF